MIEIVEIEVPAAPSVVEVSGGRGATGATGATGPAGPTGPQGPAGPSSFLWWSVNPVDIANSDRKTSQLDPDGEGSLVIAPSFWEPGRHLDLTTRGWIQAENAQTTTFEIALSSLVAEIPIVQSTGVLPNGLGGPSYFYVEARFGIRCLAAGSSGQLLAAGRTLIQIATGINTVQMRSLLAPGPVSIDLSQELTFGVFYRWHTASANNRLRLLMAELLRN